MTLILALAVKVPLVQGGAAVTLWFPILGSKICPSQGAVGSVAFAAVQPPSPDEQALRTFTRVLDGKSLSLGATEGKARLND